MVVVMMEVVCNVVGDGVVDVGWVESLILCCLGVLMTDRLTDGQTDICTS